MIITISEDECFVELIVERKIFKEVIDV